MDYRYRVKGCAEKAFILRGRHFRVGGEVDTDIFESELAFIKANCSLTKIVDRQAKTAPSQPIPNNSQTTPKGVKNELPKSTSGANKVTSNAKV